jgi:hypothetical protein
VVVNYIREFQIAAGVPRAQVYDFTMYILAGMLVLGLICNMLVKPLAPHWFMKPEEVAKLQAKGAEAASAGGGSYGIGKGGFDGAPLPSGLCRCPAVLGRLADAAERRAHLPVKPARDRQRKLPVPFHI